MAGVAGAASSSSSSFASAGPERRTAASTANLFASLRPGANALEGCRNVRQRIATHERSPGDVD